jgi:hypothetical protein
LRLAAAWGAARARQACGASAAAAAAQIVHARAARRRAQTHRGKAGSDDAGGPSPPLRVDVSGWEVAQPIARRDQGRRRAALGAGQFVLGVRDGA